MMKCVLCAFVLASFVASTFFACHAARILVVFPVRAHSHYTLGFRLVKELADRNHDVTFISAYSQERPIKNVREILLPKIKDDIIYESEKEFFDLGKMSYISQLLWVSKLGEYTTENTLKLKEVQELLQSNETFDLVLMEHSLNDAMTIFQYKFKCPLIILAPSPTTVFNNHLFANPSQSAYVPNLLTNYGPHMTLWERTKNFYYDIIGELFIHLVMIPGQNTILQRSVPGAPDLKDILYNASFLFTVSHISLKEPSPIQPNIIEIGGYHVLPPKQLPKNLQEFLDSAKEGAVVFSMGGNLRSASFSSEKKEAILNVFSRMKQKVLWKFETDLPEKPDNVKILSWIPQQQVLAHPNVVAFITHAGLLGTTEAIYHGVPVLGLPVYWDQEKNIIDVVHKGFGLRIPFHTFTEDRFDRALNELLNNTKYRENAKMRSRIMHDQPMKPLEKAMFWIEYTIRHKGAPHYKSPALKLRWYQLHMLDVVFIIFVTACAISVIVILFILRYVFKCKNKQFSKKNKVQ